LQNLLVDVLAILAILAIGSAHRTSYPSRSSLFPASGGLPVPFVSPNCN